MLYKCLIVFFHVQPFVNLITVIPITNDNNEVAFFVGLQVDLVEQPNAILEKMKGKHILFFFVCLLY